MDTMVEGECGVDEYRARLRMSRIQLGATKHGTYLEAYHPDVGKFLVKDPESLTGAERADAIAHYEEIYGPAGGTC